MEEDIAKLRYEKVYMDEKFSKQAMVLNRLLKRFRRMDLSNLKVLQMMIYHLKIPPLPKHPSSDSCKLNEIVMQSKYAQENGLNEIENSYSHI